MFFVSSNPTPLMVATLNGHIEVVKLLLTHPNIKVNLKDHQGRTALMQSAILGNSGIFKLLIERDDIDVNLKDLDGKTAYDYATNSMLKKDHQLIKSLHRKICRSRKRNRN